MHKNILYIDETWVNQLFMHENTLGRPLWLKAILRKAGVVVYGLSFRCIGKPSDAGKRFLIVQAGSADGFVPGAFLMF